MLGFLKWVGIGLGIIIALLVVIGAVFYVTGRAKMLKVQEVSPSITLVESDSSSIARGAHLAKILSCYVCHGEEMEGKVYLDIPPFKVVASNLTPGQGGVGGNYTDADWDRSLRHGVKPSGLKMLVMPSNLFYSLDDADAASLISFLKNLPAVDNPLPETEGRMPGFLMSGTPGMDLFPNIPDKDAVREPVPPVGATAEYGAYLTELSCIECHGQTLRGGKHPEPGAPDGPDLAISGQWPLEAFARAMREGQTPYGTGLRTQYMPWSQSYKHLDDVEVEALYLYLGRWHSND